MEDGKGEEEGGGNGGRTLAIWESGWCATLIMVKVLLQNISHRDRLSPSRVIGRTTGPIRGGTCPWWLWIASAIPQPSNHVWQASVSSNA